MKLDKEDVVNRSLEHPTFVLAHRNDTHLGYQVFRPPPPVERRRRWNPGPGVTEYGVVLSSEGVGVWRDILIDPPLTHRAMARRKSMTAKKLTKAQRTMLFTVPPGSSYIDIMSELSKVNRKLFKQGMAVGIESMEFLYRANPLVVDSVQLEAYVAGDTWSVHNAHVKSEALWHEMRQLVLEDNPSVESKWSDFKVFLDAGHYQTVVAGPGNLTAIDGGGVNPYLPGEWDYSEFIMPQHNVNIGTGAPDPADETFGHLLGDDVGAIGAFQSVGLVKAYEDSRSTVFPNAPNVPAGFQDSFFNLLTDSGSQEPELALEIAVENDNPPYDLLNYPGGAVNAPFAVLSEFGIANSGFPVGVLTPFVAQCGLIRLENKGYLNGGVVPGVQLAVKLTVMAGNYKGIAAIPMGQ